MKIIGLELQAEFIRKGFKAAHIKLIGQNSYRVIKGSLTNSMKEWEWNGQDQDFDFSTEITLLINARVLAKPVQLYETIISIVKKVSEQWNVNT